MGLFRNPTNEVAPRRLNRNASPDRSPLPQPDPIPTATKLDAIKPCLRTLLHARDISEPASREAEAGIRRIGNACGLYLTASTVHSHVQRLTPTDDAEKKNVRPRGFELAGELYYLHLRQQVNSIEQKPGSLGPRVFRSYCTELFDCFLEGEHVRKGVGYPIMLMETLLAKAITSPSNKSLYLALADEAMQSMDELSRRKFDKDNSDARRAVRQQKKTDTPRPESRSSHEVIDHPLFDHLQGLQRAYVAVRNGFEKTNPPNAASGRLSSTPAYAAYLRELLQFTIEGRYLGLTAMMNETIGKYLHGIRNNSCPRYVLAAAQDLEKLADKEQDLYLVVMSAQRYRKAHELYTFVRAGEKAAVTNRKLEELKAAYNPRMLILSQL